jgi:hypothetical protein
MAVDALARALAAGKVPVSAYEMAVKAGYTGTEEQFAEDMGNSGTNAANAAASASAAAASAESVSASAAQIATNTNDISDLKESLSDYPNVKNIVYTGTPFLTTKAIYDAVLYPVVGVNVYNNQYSKYRLYRMRLKYSTAQAVYTTLQGLSGENWVNIESVEIAVSDLSTLSGIALYKSNTGKFDITINWDLVSSSINGSSTYELNNSVINLKTQSIESEIATNKGNITKLENIVYTGTPFLTTKAIYDAVLYPVVGVNVYDNQYSKYRLNYLRLKFTSGTTHRTVYTSLQGSNDGSTWTPVGEVLVNADDSTFESEWAALTGLAVYTSTNGKFDITINWNVVGDRINGTSTYDLNNGCINLKTKLIDGKLTALASVDEIEDFLLMTHAKHTIDVGVGKEYTTIGAAYAAITDSSFDNQYNVRIFPGTYNEIELAPPAFTHTFAAFPGTVIVNSVGVDNGTINGKPRMEQSTFNLSRISKLSDLIVYADEGMNYCIHFDSGISRRAAICENLYCKKYYGVDASHPNGLNVSNYAYSSYENCQVIGMGMGGNAYRVEFNNCYFENGDVETHTRANNSENPNTKIIFNGCQRINSRYQTTVVGSYASNGLYICEINDDVSKFGDTSFIYAYQSGDIPWIVMGKNNKNFAVKFTKLDDTADSDEKWENIVTTDKRYIALASGVSVTKGQWIKYDGTICDNSTSAFDVYGIALVDANADTNNAIPVWCGEAYPIIANDGEYGIDATGNLSESATTKIGRVVNNIFYRY